MSADPSDNSTRLKVPHYTRLDYTRLDYTRLEIPSDLSLDILYRDEHLVVVYKPAGLLVHRSEIDRRETVFAVQVLRQQLQQRVYTVHRLDKPTSGIMVFAFNTDDAAHLSNQFQQRLVKKHYRALVRGFMPSEGTVDYAYAQRFDKLDPATHDRERKLSAITHFECLQQFEIDIPVDRYQSARFSLLQLMPESGRKHQIRRHMKHLSHPIAGDTTYGDGKQNKLLRSHFNCQRLMLSASRLQFQHPRSGENIDIKAEPDATFADVISAMN